MLPLGLLPSAWHAYASLSTKYVLIELLLAFGGMRAAKDFGFVCLLGSTLCSMI